MGYYTMGPVFPYMESPTNTGKRDLLEHVLVPVAHEDDALKTAQALEPYAPDHVTVLYVVEKGDGVPDKTSPEQSKKVAEDSFAAVRTTFPDADDHVAYGRDIVDNIFEATTEIGATAVVYRSRGGNRITQFLSGDLSLKLVTQAEVPVITLPRTETDS